MKGAGVRFPRAAAGWIVVDCTGRQVRLHTELVLLPYARPGGERPGPAARLPGPAGRHRSQWKLRGSGPIPSLVSQRGAATGSPRLALSVQRLRPGRACPCRNRHDLRPWYRLSCRERSDRPRRRPRSDLRERLLSGGAPGAVYIRSVRSGHRVAVHGGHAGVTPYRN